MSQGQLSEDLLKQIGGYTAGMQKNVSLILNKGDHEERDNLKKFLGAVASCSDRLSVEERDMSNILRSPVSFSLEAEGDVTGISFSGIKPLSSIICIAKSFIFTGSPMSRRKTSPFFDIAPA